MGPVLAGPLRLPFLVFALAAAPAGCTTDHSMNPAFPITVAEGRAALREMRSRPVELERPVVVAAGYLDPGIISRNIAARLRRATSGDAPIISTSFFWRFTFDDCRDRLIAAVEQEYPSTDPELTVEVDVIGFSMGGLVARHAAAMRPEGDGKRLNIKRLFTIGTPHRGARLAGLAPFDRRAIDMRAQSKFLAGLDRDMEDARYEIIPYARLNDAIVGIENAAPAGSDPWWVPNKSLSMSHTMAGADERILADIAKRLRSEAHFTGPTPHPPPPGE